MQRTESLEIGAKLHTGPNTTIYKANWRGCQVAVKMFNLIDHMTPKMTQDFENSIDGLWCAHRRDLLTLFYLMFIFSGIRQENLASVFGVVAERKTLAVVMEYVENGTLLDLIQKGNYNVVSVWFIQSCW